MGSPKDKTDYLNETKIRIRDGINRLGGSLTPSNTFRSYANELLNILSAMPKVTGEGSNITLNNTKSNGPMSILVQGNEDGNKVVTGQNSITINKNNEEQVYPLSLGDIELYEGDEIQGDFIYRDGGEIEEITNTTLLTQLANLEKAKSYEDQTNVVITSDSNNAQMTAQVVALRKLV